LTGINKEGGLLSGPIWDTVSLSPRKKHVLFVSATYKVLKMDQLDNSKFLHQLNTQEIYQFMRIPPVNVVKAIEEEK
jgi:hypothetical protein